MPVRLYIYHALSYVVAAILVYTATRKLLDYTSYAAHIRDVGLFSREWSMWAANGVIGIEYAIALALMLPVAGIRVWGWRAIVLLMAVYSYYIYYILYRAPFVPCACKGAYERLGWQGHFYLNIELAVLALWSCRIYDRWINKKHNIHITKA